MRCTDHNGRWFSSVKEMCTHYGITTKIFLYRRTHHWSLRKSLTKPKQKQPFYFRGELFKSRKELCERYKLNYNRMNYMCDEKCYTPAELAEKWLTDGTRGFNSFKDHKGNVYRSFNEMVRAYGLYPTTVHQRMQKYGWDLEKALTTPLAYKWTSTRNRIGKKK